MSAKMSELAQKIEKWRVHRGNLSRVALSKRAGLGDSAVNDIVTHADRSPRIATVEAIANALDVPLSALLPEAATTEHAHGLEQVDPAEIKRRGRLTNAGIDIATERNEPGTAFYTIATSEFSSFGFSAGDLISVDTRKAPASGQVVAVAIGVPNESQRLTLRYFAEPLLFGFQAGTGPCHEYAAAPDVRIIGRVTACVRLCPE